VLTLLAAAHLCGDFYQGAIPALLPFFIAAHHLTYAAAAGLVLAANVLSSVLQPLFGWWADRRPQPWLMAAGIACVGTGVSLAALAPTYPVTFGLVALGGLGIAAFHPEATRFAHHVAGSRRGVGMSVFALGGNLGFALGPLVAAPLAATFGLPAVAVLVVPALGMTALLLAARPALASSHAAHTAHAAGDGQAAAYHAVDRWRAFGLLTTVVVCRSVVVFALTTFLPLYWIRVLRQPQAAGGLALSVLLGAGVAGTLLGGYAADRYGRKPVIVTAFLLLPVLLLLVLQVQRPAWALALLVPLGLALFAPFSVMVVLGQEYLPRHLGMASGVTLGLAVTVGGLAAPALGVLADHHGVRLTLLAVTGLPALAAVLAAVLPHPDGPSAPPVEPVEHRAAVRSASAP